MNDNFIHDDIKVATIILIILCFGYLIYKIKDEIYKFDKAKKNNINNSRKEYQKENNIKDTRFEIDDLIQKYKEYNECDKKSEKNQYECPKCGSNSISVHRLPPFFIKEYTCEDCEHYWSSRDKEKTKKVPYVCINCGSYNLKWYDFSDDCCCIDCDYVGPPFIPDV